LIRRHVPEMARLHGAVRVAQLLNLTSGLNGPRANPEFGVEAQRREQNQQYADARKLEYFTPAELIAAAAPLPAHAPPGAVWRYDLFPLAAPSVAPVTAPGSVTKAAAATWDGGRRSSSVLACCSTFQAPRKMASKAGWPSSS
jgi:hypothetical protein